MPSSIIDFHLGSLIFPGGEDLGLPTPSSNKIQPPGSCILFENFTSPHFLLRQPSHDIRNRYGDLDEIFQQLTELEKCRRNRLSKEIEEMQNPVPVKLNFRSKGKITRMYIQSCHTVTDHKEQLTGRTFRKNKLMWKSENSLPFHSAFPSLEVSL